MLTIKGFKKDTFSTFTIKYALRFYLPTFPSQKFEKANYQGSGKELFFVAEVENRACANKYRHGRRAQQR